MKEIWKSPPSLNTPWFEVSNLGNCRTKKHIEKCYLKGKLISRVRDANPSKFVSIDPRGRRQVATPMTIERKKNGCKPLVFIHRLVAECFVHNDNPEKNTMVFFKDKDFSNCRADNLYWADTKEKGFRSNFAKTPVGMFMTADKGEKPVKVFESGSALGKFIGVTKQAVHAALRDRRSCSGYFVRPIESTSEHIMTMREVVEFKHDVPDAIFSKKRINISRKAIFK